jgi:hypothetical protein
MAPVERRGEVDRCILEHLHRVANEAPPLDARATRVYIFYIGRPLLPAARAGRFFMKRLLVK